MSVFSRSVDASQFRRLLESLPAGAYACDADGLITFYNANAEALWGRAPTLNDPIDRFCGSFKLFAADGTPITHDKCWMALALKNRREYNGEEIWIERPDGQMRAALAHAKPIYDTEGELAGAMNILVDITDRKEAERLRIEADRRKDEFLATLAHELRNPLAPISNSLQILRMSSDLSPVDRAVRDVLERQVKHLVRLVDDLLEIARITQGKIELRCARVELLNVLGNAVEISRPLIDAAKHQLAIAISPVPMTLCADEVRLTQTIANLLNNAAKYTPPGGQIWLTAKPEGQEAVIRVSDSGQGISSEMLDRIFEMFAQVDRTPQRAQGGLGIGLTLAKNLVEMHGGTITAHSPGVGQGSEFVVRLPLAPPAESTDLDAALRDVLELATRTK